MATNYMGAELKPNPYPANTPEADQWYQKHRFDLRGAPGSMLVDPNEATTNPYPANTPEAESWSYRYGPGSKSNTAAYSPVTQPIQQVQSAQPNPAIPNRNILATPEVLQKNPNLQGGSPGPTPAFNPGPGTNAAAPSRYDDAELSRRIGGNKNVEQNVGTINQYLDQLSNDQLLQRYKGISDAGISDLGQYLRETYGTGNAKDESYFSAYKNAKDALGRELTANEMAQFGPLFYNPADPSSGIATGRQALASYASKQAKTPESLSKKAPDYYGNVDQSIHDFLNRTATPEERDHFGKLLASGEVDSYQLNDFIKQLPEYQQNQDKTFRQDLGKELTGYDTDFFKKAKEDVISRFAQNGTLGSSGLDYALTDLMGNIQKQRSAYMADLSASQYGGNKANARQDYLTQMDQFLNNQNYNRQLQDQNNAYYRDRSSNAYDYATQRNDYMNTLNSMSGKRRGGLGSAFGPLLGAGLGAAFAAPSGGMSIPAGAALGGKFGEAGGNAFDFWNY